MLDRRVFIALVLLTLSASDLFAQREWNVWYGGGWDANNFSWGIEFNSNPPKFFTSDSLTDFTLEDAGGAGYACIAHRGTGALLFYTSGRTVWNRYDRRTPNGTGLL